MEFEFDSVKSRGNLAKHGIDFIEAQQIWDDPNAEMTPARMEDETRWIVTGYIKHIHWSAIITFRGEFVRIISVRRSREQEKTWYESQRV